ncbi:MAG: hypothetical protein IAE84_14340 [Saprospiraceae bacterium]|nr:hypothetical protein [Saprospiraceae bacterium]HRJ13657.1 hypothetical protein [Saprospiraceae bacterium]
MKEQLYERIEAYIAGALSEEERARLEQEIAADPALAEEVALHRSLDQLMADKGKMNFRRQLDEVGQAYAQPPASGLRWFWPVVLLAGALAALWWFILRPQPEPTLAPIPEAPTVQDTIADVPPPQDTAPLAPPPKPEKPAPRDLFAPVPALEKAIQKEPDAYFTIETALLDALPGADARSRQIRFSGRLLTAMDLPKLELQLLDNTRPDGKLVVRIPVTATLVEEDENIRAFAAKKLYLLDAAQNLLLPNGLYYAQLVVVADNKVLWTGKVGGGR